MDDAELVDSSTLLVLYPLSLLFPVFYYLCSANETTEEAKRLPPFFYTTLVYTVKTEASQ